LVGDEEVVRKAESKVKAREFIRAGRVEKATKVIDEQLSALSKIMSMGPAGVIHERAERWVDLVSRELTETISPQEGKKLRDRSGAFGRNLLVGATRARDFLLALKRDIGENPKAYFPDAMVARQDASVPARASFETTDQLIIDALQKDLPSAARSYEQALTDLAGVERLSWRGPATDLREALRETLDHLAPDNEVEKQSDYKHEAETDGPTMKQKVRYVLRKRSATSPTEDSTTSAAEAVEATMGTFVRSVYRRSAVSTHTPTDRTEVFRVRDLVRAVLVELLQVR
jgi:hypothetical protein